MMHLMESGFAVSRCKQSRLKEEVRRLTFNDPSITRLRIPTTAVGRDVLRSVATALKSNTHLEDLRFHGGSLSIDVILALAHSMSSNTSLKRLRLEHVEMSSTGAKHLFNALETNKRVEELHLYENNLNESTATALRSLLEHNDTLKVLSMKQNFVGTALSCQKTHLEQLELTECWGCTSGIHDVIRNNNSIKRLYLIHTDVRASDLVYLFERLKQNTSVEELVITRTAFDNEATESLGSLLRETKTLRKLRLWGNQIGDDGMSKVSHGLRQNKSGLTELRLVENNIANAGASALSCALAANPMIQQVDLSGNKISNDGAQALLNLAKQNANIESLTVRDNNGIDSSIAAEIAFHVRLNKALEPDGRRSLGDVSLPCEKWLDSLERVKSRHEPDLMYFVVRQRPDIFASRN